MVCQHCGQPFKKPHKCLKCRDIIDEQECKNNGGYCDYCVPLNYEEEEE